jgi:hypothetical protein
MQRRGEFFLISTVIFTILALVITSFTATSVFEKIDDFLLYNMNEEFSRCVNIENCTLRNFTDFLKHVCSERSYNLSLVYFYCNTTHLEIGNFYHTQLNITINSEIDSKNLSLADNEVIFYDLAEIGRNLNVSYLTKEIQFSCDKKTIARDFCLSFLNSLKCLSDIN